MKILMVTPYAPIRDGIASYAIQEVERLAEAGHEVEILSPYPSAAHHHLDFGGVRGGLALAKRVRGYDKLIVQFHPEIFYRIDSSDWALVSLSLAMAFRLARKVEARVHEVDYSIGRRPGLLRFAMKRMWRAVDRVEVHSESEAEAFSRAFAYPSSRVVVSDHGAHFVRRTQADKNAARASLGMSPDEFAFLSIGFVQPHKGFDRAIRAFGDLGRLGCRFYVVGSVRLEEAEYLQHAAELRQLASETPGVKLHEVFVSDEEFDRWIVACDVVVLPYRHIWSSGVMERAALYDRPVIATRVGGLQGQARENAVLVDDDAELAQAMAQAAMSRTGHESAYSRPWNTVAGATREAIMSEIRTRAAADRGLPFPLVRQPGLARDRLELTGQLRKLGGMVLTPPRAKTPLGSLVKRVVKRLTEWELGPIVRHMNAIQRETIEAIEKLGDERSRPKGGSS